MTHFGETMVGHPSVYDGTVTVTGFDIQVWTACLSKTPSINYIALYSLIKSEG